MCRLLMTSLFLCLWLVENGQGSLGETLEELHTEFAVGLFQTLTETDNNSNLIVSPASVSMSLGLLQFGARGNTLSQLEGALRYNSNEMRMQDFLQQVQGDSRNSTQALRVQLACALFVQSGMQLSQEFTQHASAWANSSVVHTNFSQPNHTRGQVEQWVRSRGNGDAHALLAGEELAGLVEAQGGPSLWGQTQMALVSSVAFRGTWQRQFLFAETRTLPFTLSDGTTIKVPMMYQASEVKFGQFRTLTDHRYTVVELSYLGDSLSLMVALPSERKVPLAHLETQLTPRAMALWAGGLRRTKMDVFLPRFKIQNRFNLKSMLLSLGISDMFDPMAADFGGISAEDGLYVSEAIHEAKIEVTEEGTKAAAATAMVLLKRSRAPVFKADRPFLFLLREASTGSVLFMGRVMNPAVLV
ncbi:probable serpin E3 isoform X1 [Anguilla anguilla]|uniref:probable serpin E3 isoform X1 n=1 Tax=Anguilla anguilla TaxID=7936 RepID=UPI0015ADBCBE|nr:probable serpin E3 isoform X1 [Anguilla anguilla]